MTTNAQKQREEFSTLESIFGKESFTVEKQGPKSHDKIVKLKLSTHDSVSLLIPSGYPSDNLPILLRSGKSKNLTPPVLDQIDAKLHEIFMTPGDGLLYELFQWYSAFSFVLSYIIVLSG